MPLFTKVHTLYVPEKISIVSTFLLSIDCNYLFLLDLVLLTKLNCPWGENCKLHRHFKPECVGLIYSLLELRRLPE